MKARARNAGLVFALALAAGAHAGDPPRPRPDALGDPLPTSALHRIGTTRFKHPGGISALAVSRDGKLVATGGLDTTVRLFEPASAKELRRLEGHREKVTAVVFSSDGKLLVTGSLDKTVIVWDPARGEELKRLAGHTLGISQLSIAPDVPAAK